MIAHTIDKRDIFYRVNGSGTAMLLVHGGWPGHFEPLVEVLSPMYQCITFDRLGFSQSARLTQNTTIEEQVAAMEAVHDSITTDPVWVFGWSSGGNFALGYALFRPERVKGLVLVEPALYAIYSPEQPPEVKQMKEEVIPLIQQGQLDKGWDRFVEVLFGPQDGEWHKSEEELEIIRAFGYDQPIVIDWCPSKEELGQITQPVLILEGDQSPALLRDICPFLDNQLANSKLVRLEGQDHMMPNTAPNLVAETLTHFISDQELK